jgi:hypothetical protein
MTIENPTSFWRHCREVDGSYLALLTDGFPARDVLSGIIHMVKEARLLGDVPVFHWGDIDAGGARIAAHLEDHLDISLRLHQMKPENAILRGTTLTNRHGLQEIGTRDNDVGRLARWLSSPEGKALEQEELDPLCPILAKARTPV